MRRWTGCRRPWHCSTPSAIRDGSSRHRLSFSWTRSIGSKRNSRWARWRITSRTMKASSTKMEPTEGSTKDLILHKVDLTMPRHATTFSTVSCPWTSTKPNKYIRISLVPQIPPRSGLSWLRWMVGVAPWDWCWTLSANSFDPDIIIQENLRDCGLL